MELVDWDLRIPAHQEFRKSLRRRAKAEARLPTTHAMKALAGLGESPPPSIRYFFQILKTTRDRQGRNKQGRAALLFGPHDSIVLEDKTLPTHLQEVRRDLSELNRGGKARRQFLVLLESDGLPRGQVRLKPLGTEVGALEPWGLTPKFPVERVECPAKAKGCRGSYLPDRRDRSSCGNPGCRAVVVKRGLSERVRRKREKERRETREWYERTVKTFPEG